MLHSHRLNLKCSLAFRDIRSDGWEWNCSVNEYHLPINRARLTQTNSIHCCQKKSRTWLSNHLESSSWEGSQPRHSKIQIKHFVQHLQVCAQALSTTHSMAFSAMEKFELINFIHSRNLFGLRLYRVRLNVEKMQSRWLKFQFFARAEENVAQSHKAFFLLSSRQLFAVPKSRLWL